MSYVFSKRINLERREGGRRSNVVGMEIANEVGRNNQQQKEKGW